MGRFGIMTMYRHTGHREILRAAQARSLAQRARVAEMIGPFNENLRAVLELRQVTQADMMRGLDRRGWLSNDRSIPMLRAIIAMADLLEVSIVAMFPPLSGPAKLDMVPLGHAMGEVDWTSVDERVLRWRTHVADLYLSHGSSARWPLYANGVMGQSVYRVMVDLNIGAPQALGLVPVSWEERDVYRIRHGRRRIGVCAGCGARIELYVCQECSYRHREADPTPYSAARRIPTIYTRYSYTNEYREAPAHTLPPLEHIEPTKGPQPQEGPQKVRKVDVAAETLPVPWVERRPDLVSLQVNEKDRDSAGRFIQGVKQAGAGRPKREDRRAVISQVQERRKAWQAMATGSRNMRQLEDLLEGTKHEAVAKLDREVAFILAAMFQLEESGLPLHIATSYGAARNFLTRCGIIELVGTGYRFTAPGVAFVDNTFLMEGIEPAEGRRALIASYGLAMDYRTRSTG